MSTQRLVAASAVILSLVGLGAGCGAATTSAPANTAVAAPTPAAPVNTTTATTDTAAVSNAAADTNTTAEVTATTTTKNFTITAKKFSFDPAEITVQQGDTVRLTINSVDVQHGFSLPEFDVEESLTPGTTVEVEFVADTAGSFTYSCSFFCGAGHTAMKGTLIVQ